MGNLIKKLKNKKRLPISEGNNEENIMQLTKIPSFLRQAQGLWPCLFSFIFALVCVLPHLAYGEMSAGDRVDLIDEEGPVAVRYARYARHHRLPTPAPVPLVAPVVGNCGDQGAVNPVAGAVGVAVAGVQDAFCSQYQNHEGIRNHQFCHCVADHTARGDSHYPRLTQESIQRLGPAYQQIAVQSSLNGIELEYKTIGRDLLYGFMLPERINGVEFISPELRTRINQSACLPGNFEQEEARLTTAGSCDHNSKEFIGRALERISRQEKPPFNRSGTASIGRFLDERYVKKMMCGTYLGDPNCPLPGGAAALRDTIRTNSAVTISGNSLTKVIRFLTLNLQAYRENPQGYAVSIPPEMNSLEVYGFLAQHTTVGNAVGLPLDLEGQTFDVTTLNEGMKQLFANPAFTSISATPGQSGSSAVISQTAVQSGLISFYNAQMELDLTDCEARVRSRYQRLCEVTKDPNFAPKSIMPWTIAHLDHPHFSDEQRDSRRQEMARLFSEVLGGDYTSYLGTTEQLFCLMKNNDFDATHPRSALFDSPASAAYMDGGGIFRPFDGETVRTAEENAAFNQPAIVSTATLHNYEKEEEGSRYHQANSFEERVNGGNIDVNRQRLNQLMDENRKSVRVDKQEVAEVNPQSVTPVSNTAVKVAADSPSGSNPFGAGSAFSGAAGLGGNPAIMPVTGDATLAAGNGSGSGAGAAGGTGTAAQDLERRIEDLRKLISDREKRLKEVLAQRENGQVTGDSLVGAAADRSAEIDSLRSEIRQLRTDLQSTRDRRTVSAPAPAPAVALAAPASGASPLTPVGGRRAAPVAPTSVAPASGFVAGGGNSIGPSYTAGGSDHSGALTGYDLSTTLGFVGSTRGMALSLNGHNFTPTSNDLVIPRSEFDSATGPRRIQIFAFASGRPIYVVNTDQTISIYQGRQLADGTWEYGGEPGRGIASLGDPEVVPDEPTVPLAPVAPPPPEERVRHDDLLQLLRDGE